MKEEYNYKQGDWLICTFPDCKPEMRIRRIKEMVSGKTARDDFGEFIDLTSDWYVPVEDYMTNRQRELIVSFLVDHLKNEKYIAEAVTDNYMQELKNK